MDGAATKQGSIHGELTNQRRRELAIISLQLHPNMYSSLTLVVPLHLYKP